MKGHAYSVVQVKEIDQFKLIKLRNPWGSFEWKGNWSDNSPLWKQYPKVARAVDFVAADDGMFWMVGVTLMALLSVFMPSPSFSGFIVPLASSQDFKDFQQYYKNLDLCLRTTGWDDLVLDIHEESPICGWVLCFI